MINIVTLSYIILLYVIRVLVVIGLRIFIIKTEGKYGGYKLHQILNNNLFFNNIIQLIIESMLEFQISGYLNILGLI